MGVCAKDLLKRWWGRICSSTGSCSGNVAPECWRRMVLPRLLRVGGNYSWLSSKFCRILIRSCSSFGDLKKRGGGGGGIYTTNQKAPPNMKRCSCCKMINTLDSRLGLLPIADRENNIRAGWYSSLKIFQRLLRGFSILGFQYWPKPQADCKQPDADINYLFGFDCLQESWDAPERRWRV
jgi:hypothetical protein